MKFGEDDSIVFVVVFFASCLSKMDCLLLHLRVVVILSPRSSGED